MPTTKHNQLTNHPPQPPNRLHQPTGTSAVAHEVDVALSNSFGFGGHNSCIMFRRFRGPEGAHLFA